VTTSHQLPELYATIRLGDTTSPGRVTLSGHDRKKEWDVQRAKGATGASNKLNGDPLGTFSATFEFDERDEESWNTFQRTAESTVNGTTPVALPIFHPDLARQKITKVTLASMGGVVRDDKGLCKVKVDFIEYSPPKPKPVQPTKPGTGNGSKTAPKPDPNKAAKDRLAGLVDEANSP